MLGAAGRRSGRGRLTVLAYHRIADPAAPGFAGHPGNVSAAPGAFAAQLDWVAERFDVVGLGDLLGWLDGDGDLPRRPLLITFDDGYRDNLEVAAPVLAARGLPAVLFLTSGPLDGGPALHWDRAAGAFSAAASGDADLPVVGRRGWVDAGSRDRVRDEFVAATKRLHPHRRAAALAALGEALGVEVPETLPGLYLDWDGVRALEGWAMGSHTVDHAVLTSLGAGEAVEQVATCARRIEEETGSTVRAFAFPNGMPGDFGGPATAAVATAGIDVAFTLLPGPARLGEVRSAPLEVRRVLVEYRDDAATFAAKVIGLPRWGGR